MNAPELIGRAATAYLIKRISAEHTAEGTARFLLDRLQGTHVAAVCREILDRPELAGQTRLRIPRILGETNGLPQEVLTDERTTYWRNSVCDRPVLILANTDDDQGQSLRDITPIGSLELLTEVENWVAEAAEGLGLADRHLTMW